MAILEKENRSLMGKKESSKDLQKQFQGTSQELTAVDWYDKASALWAGGKYTDPQKAIEYLSQAIRLKPDYAEAYSKRADLYALMRIFERAKIVLNYR
ncbi:MAG: tetratricopeptide repeat protein [Syntrophales bacterium]